MNIYQRAKINGCYLDADCVSCGRFKWDELMQGATRANKKEVTKIALLAGVISKEQAAQEIRKPYYNPYNHHKTKTHIIYVHSSIEYFIRVN